MERRLLLVSGSLRAGSTNSAALRTLARLLPAGVQGLFYEGLGSLPAFNPDEDHEPLTPKVAELRTMIHNASGIIFSTPEYAGALPGTLKNLLDWTIGDAEAGSIYQKPVAWINVSPRGAVEAHDELRRVLTYAHADIVEEVCTLVPITAQAIGDDGQIIDLSARQRIAEAGDSLLRHLSGDVAVAKA
jgi:NAD(P)H-dependent FMN reductase